MDLKITVHLTDDAADNSISVVADGHEFELECLAADEIKNMSIGELIRLLSES